MDASIIGYTSLVLILIATVLHVRRVWSGEIVIHPISWAIWFLVSFAILLSYNSMETKYELYAAIGNVIYPGSNFLLSFRQKVKIELSYWDYAALLIAVLAMILWWLVKNDAGLSSYANYLAIIADMCALIPTILLVKSNPMIEKPLPWICFSLGFGVSIFAITSHSIANYILPLYMLIGAGAVAVIQIQYRKRNNIRSSWY